MELTRRGMLSALGAAATLATPVSQALAQTAATGADLRKVKILLNSGIAGPHAFFCLANERGYFKDAGLEIQFDAGDGAASSVTLATLQGYDGCYGDVSALIKLAGLRPQNCPTAVHVAFNTTPLTIAVRKDGPIKDVKDLKGKVIIGHPIDAALEAFPPYAKVGGLDPDSIHILRSNASMAINAKDVVDGNVDGVFGFVHTIIAALKGIDIDGREKLHFLEYRDLIPELYGNALMMSPDFIAKNPEAVKGLVAAVNRGIVETLKDPEAALNAVEKMAPKFKREVDGPRMMGTLEVEMAHPEGAVIGIGDVDDKRISRSIDLMVEACRLPHTPKPEQIFTRAFLPPLEERAKPLAKKQ
ncbi:MAG: ABC transporter substrate-binding protein [Rhizobiaceae bacterium]